MVLERGSGSLLCAGGRAALEEGAAGPAAVPLWRGMGFY